MPTKLEKLLALLCDNQWHNMKTIAENLEIPEEKFRQMIAFLAEADIIKQNQTNQIKLSQNWKTLLISQKETNSETKQGTTAIGTIIIPPQKTLIIQCTRITNLTDTNLELEIRMNKRIREIAINKIK